MGSFADLVTRTGRPEDFRGALAEIRAEHGSGAARYLAGLTGKSVRTAQRWLKGQHAPGGRSGTRPAREAQQQLVNSVNVRTAAARHIRSADRLVLGTVVIQASSFGGKRNVGEIPVTPQIQARLDDIADAVASGDPDAESMFQDLILEAYFNKGNVGGRHRTTGMGISEYSDSAYILGD